jgi:hypothetical protein
MPSVPEQVARAGRQSKWAGPRVSETALVTAPFLVDYQQRRDIRGWQQGRFRTGLRDLAAPTKSPSSDLQRPFRVI